MAGNICEEQAADATGSAARNVVDIAATLSLAEGLAIDPDIETAEFDSTGRELAASPDLHALHVLCGGIGHGSIIAAEGEIMARPNSASAWVLPTTSRRSLAVGPLHLRGLLNHRTKVAS